jgi:RNA polymerase sigma-70 factor (ECF subfamily)
MSRAARSVKTPGPPPNPEPPERRKRNVVSIEHHLRRKDHERPTAPEPGHPEPSLRAAAAVLALPGSDRGAHGPEGFDDAPADGGLFDDDAEAADDAGHADSTALAAQAPLAAGGGADGAPETARTRAALPPPLADEQMAVLLARIVHQDQRALERLYDATAGRVHALVLRIVGRRALAEEVVEDTFWQVWRQAARFDAARGRPMTWLLAMARSRAIDALRRDQRFRHDELPDDDHADAPGAAPPPQDLLEATRHHAAVHAALALLDARSRQLVALAFFRGLTHEEIAAQQGLPLGTVKSLIRRALAQLRRALEASDD